MKFPAFNNTSMIMSALKTLNILLLALPILFFNCKHDATGIDQLDKVCFEKDVLPIFQANCNIASCHGIDRAGDYDFRTYEGILSGVNAGNPKKSILYGAITQTWGNKMPPKDSNPLNKDMRTIIYVWIEQGALNTVCPPDNIIEDTDLYPDTICYEQKIEPIFLASCSILGCHDQTTAKNGIDLSSYASLMSNSSQLITPGYANGSIIYNAVNTNMPPKPFEPLDEIQKKKLRTWIHYGALNSSCGTLDKLVPDTIIPIVDSICFEQFILPILNSSCALINCHDNITAQGDITLNSYAGLMAQGSEPLVIPGSASGSKVMKLINETNLEDRMPPPPNSALTSKQKEWFTTWINEGALNSSCESGCDTTNVTYSQTIRPLIENYCIGCHSGQNLSGGVDLSSYNGVNVVATNGKLVHAVNRDAGFVAMPPNIVLPDCNVRQIEIWVANGVNNNKK